MGIKTKKNIEQSKYLTDLKPKRPLVKGFDGKAFMVDGVQHKYVKMGFKGWWFRLWNKKVDKDSDIDNDWPNDWAKKGDIDD